MLTAHRAQDTLEGLRVQVLGAVDGQPRPLPVHVPSQPQVHLWIAGKGLGRAVQSITSA